MRKTPFVVFRAFVLAALVPALSLSLVSCDPENAGGGGTVAPEVSVPKGYVNYFIEDLSFGRSAGEANVAFQINVDWKLKVVGASSWCCVEPASGGAGLHRVTVSVTDNDTYEPRSARIHLMCGGSKAAEIRVSQDSKTSVEAVDLGLSVRWANCNVGADSPEEYGGYYAWGEIKEKDCYEWSTYKWCNGSSDTMTKYCTNSSYGTVDNKTVLDPADDVAHVEWGGNWRMPTVNEIDELINKCTWEYTTVNGVTVQKVTGPNGNSIFLPAAGYRFGTEVYGRGSYGDYWSGTLDEGFSYNACDLYFVGGDWNDWDYLNRSYGFSVRPVTD